jgi:hypothetical protein
MPRVWGIWTLWRRRRYVSLYRSYFKCHRLLNYIIKTLNVYSCKEYSYLSMVLKLLAHGLSFHVADIVLVFVSKSDFGVCTDLGLSPPSSILNMANPYMNTLRCETFWEPSSNCGFFFLKTPLARVNFNMSRRGAGWAGKDFFHGADRFAAGRHGRWRFARIPSFPSSSHLCDRLPLPSQPSRQRAAIPSKSSLPVKEQPSRQRAAFPSKSSLPVKE